MGKGWCGKFEKKKTNTSLDADFSPILYLTVPSFHRAPYHWTTIIPSYGFFNNSLNAEQATNYELGFRGEWIPNKLYSEVAAYFFHLNNTIVTRRDAVGADYFVNTGQTEQKGMEFSLNYYPIRNSVHFFRELICWSNVTLIDAAFKTYQQGAIDYSGKKLLEKKNLEAFRNTPPPSLKL